MALLYQPGAGQTGHFALHRAERKVKLAGYLAEAVLRIRV